MSHLVSDREVFSGTKLSESTGAQNLEPIPLSSFTRLCLILRDDEMVHGALTASGQPLECERQYWRMNRGSFWETIAERVNDAHLTPQIDLRGILEGIDPSVPPL